MQCNDHFKISLPNIYKAFVKSFDAIGLFFALMFSVFYYLLCSSPGATIE